MAYTVYKHTSPSGKVYIGITSIDPAKRWKQGYSHNKHFSMAIKKYGWENIKSEIIASGLTKNEACEMEIFLIKQYKSTDQNLGYNISTGGECGRAGATFSLESREKMIGERNPFYGRKHTEESRSKVSEKNSKKVICLETGEIFKSSIFASRSMGLNDTAVSGSIRGKSKTAGGFHWKYLEETKNEN